ncbi:MAG: DNA helicase UvrD [Bacteroidetes bacterium]|nr:MAG: DNA helicase UvrD [Bacteroidota bacterium]
MEPETKPDTQHPELNITILSAGAGSGKTYTLTGRMVDLLKNGVRPRGIIATTFTQKAAAELQERVRGRLLASGMLEAANELGSALIGTVHSIGVRLLQRFAFEAGVSPLVEIIADDDQQRLFNESLSQVLSEQRIHTMNTLADRLGLTKKKDGEPYDWRRDIRQITDVARANNFSRAVLEKSKQSSWESFEALLPPVLEQSDLNWNNRLLALIDQTVAALDDNEADGTKTTRDAAEEIRNLQHQLKWRGELYWHEWVKISKVKVGAKSRDLFEDLREFARNHDAHPKFRDDIRRFLELVFDISIDALGEYELYKKKRGLIDYTDMETYVSRLLRIDTVRETLRQELDLLLVDEFQDTSPIQLDIFLQLSRLARHSIWVGDPKQSIYGFRGAEPALMQAVIEATGGVRPENVLGQSWRSRPDIVYAVNAIFTKAFDQMPPEQVALEPALDDKELNMPQALMHWHFRNELDDRRVPGSPWMENCIAAQIQVLLDRKIPVRRKGTKGVLPVNPGDIAVLCRSNAGCDKMAEALHRAGLKAAIARAGLLATPEGRLVLACLKYLLNPADALSAAEILALTGIQTLDQLIDDRLNYLQQVEQGGDAGRWATEHVFIRQLLQLRPRTADLSASEILNLALDELDLRRIVVRLGNSTQRLDNLDTFRHYALEYESACQRLHAAASLGGFLLWLDALGRSGQDYQGSGERPDAVKVLTYHKSKGLEFPVAICHNLNDRLREKVWGINLVSEQDKPDLDDILGHRWLRFWVNPYGDQWRNTRLEETLLVQDTWMQASQQAREEEARLMYVGLTRARDYLVFPTNPKGTPWLNRVFNQGDADIPTLEPDGTETPFVWNGQVLHCMNEPLFMPRDFPEVPVRTEAVSYHRELAGRPLVERVPQRIDLHLEWPPGFKYTLGEPQAFASWLEFTGEYTPVLSRAAQTFLVADDPALAKEQRLELAQLQAHIRGVADQLDAGRMLVQSEAFRKFINNSYSGAQWHIQFPMEGPQGRRWLRVEADLLVIHAHGVAVFLFAGFADSMKKWKDQAKPVAQVAGWINRLLPQAFPGKDLQYWLVYPLEGQVVELLVQPVE